MWAALCWLGLLAFVFGVAVLVYVANGTLYGLWAMALLFFANFSETSKTTTTPTKEKTNA